MQLRTARRRLSPDPALDQGIIGHSSLQNLAEWSPELVLTVTDPRDLRE